jgi:hypothetical protein
MLGNIPMPKPTRAQAAPQVTFQHSPALVVARHVQQAPRRWGVLQVVPVALLGILLQRQLLRCAPHVPRGPSPWRMQARAVCAHLGNFQRQQDLPRVILVSPALFQFLVEADALPVLLAPLPWLERPCAPVAVPAFSPVQLHQIVLVALSELFHQRQGVPNVPVVLPGSFQIALALRCAGAALCPPLARQSDFLNARIVWLVLSAVRQPLQLVHHVLPIDILQIRQVRFALCVRVVLTRQLPVLLASTALRDFPLLAEVTVLSVQVELSL